MELTEKLPLPLDALPDAIRRFCDPGGPTPARMMAAKGVVPVRGNDQIFMLAQLGHDADEGVRDAARATLMGMPSTIIQPACEAALHPAVLDFLGKQLSDAELLGSLVANNATADETVLRVARGAGEMLCERIAVNEQRLLRFPTIIEALYKNRNMRMSTADRLVELAARNNVELTGIPCFKAHVEALEGQLIPEASDEPLPQDEEFQKTLNADSDEDAFEENEEDGKEDVRKKFLPLNMQIMKMNKSEKIRMALVGSVAARAILVRDRNKQIAFSAVSSPQTTLAEATNMAHSKEVSEEILRFIGNKREWIRGQEIKEALVWNPKTPVGVSMKFISHLRLDQLKKLAKSRNVPGQIKAVASSWVMRREKS